MEIDKLNEALASLPLGGIRSFDSIGSTNDEASAWADAGCADLSLVIADEQTRGRGRFDRKWVTRPGSSLAFSLVLKPTPSEEARLPLFAPLCGLALWQALRDLYKQESKIKWPNDLLIDRQKCAGVLVEAAWTGSNLNGIVLGIGINVSPDSVPPMTDQLFPATSIEAAVGHAVDRFQLLASVLRSIIFWRNKLGSPEFFETWQSHLAFLGESVKIVQSPKASIIGVIKGIDSNGRLVLTQPGNIETAIDVGDVHLRPADLPPAPKES